MKKRSLSFTRGATWVAAGLLVGAGIGTGVGFLVVNLNDKYENKNQFGEAISSQDILMNDGAKLNLSEYDSKDTKRESIFGNRTDKIIIDGKETNAVELGTKTLSYKIKTRLGYGPEIAQLKGIRITGEGSWTEANGVYFGGTNEIFINSMNIIEGLNKAQQSIGNFTQQQEIEYVAEYVFQIIAHEYNHHMAYTYLNSRFTEAVPSLFGETPVYVDVKGESAGQQEAWDKDFYDTFVKTLNYDSSDPIEENAFLLSMANIPAKQIGNDTYNPISKDFTAADIFRYANDKNVTTIHHGSTTWKNNLKYGFFKYDNPAAEFTPKMLSYQYSLAELYARKVQQLTMPIQLNFKDIQKADGTVIEYPLPDYRNLELKASDIINNQPWDGSEGKLFGVDQLVWGFVSGTGYRGLYSPFILDTKNYADAWNSEPFASDYLYNANNNTKAYAIYDAILQEMGYSGENVKDGNNQAVASEQADISKIWWKNDSIVQTDGTMLYPLATRDFNMGGYVNDKYSSIGYKDDTGKYVKLSDIILSTFTFGAKEKLISSSRDAAHIANDDKYFWTMNGYGNFDTFKGKDLFFSRDKTADEIKQELIALNNGETDSSKWTITDVDEKTIDAPVSSYNSEANTWLSLDSLVQRSGINFKIGYPTYDSNTFGIRLEEQ